MHVYLCSIHVTNHPPSPAAYLDQRVLKTVASLHTLTDQPILISRLRRQQNPPGPVARFFLTMPRQLTEPEFKTINLATPSQIIATTYIPQEQLRGPGAWERILDACEGLDHTGTAPRSDA